MAEDALLGLYRDRVIALDALVWREGLDNMVAAVRLHRHPRAACFH
ncbi:hypothetical protein XAV_18675 [Xanthomonas axonopodis pv. vasculorum]|nr:hypothetical protein XAV_18675 [Xanthomonas axonopodis pv. vasculorum]